MRKVAEWPILWFVLFGLFVASVNWSWGYVIDLPTGYYNNVYAVNIATRDLAFNPNGDLYVRHNIGDHVFITKFKSNSYSTVSFGRNTPYGQMAFDPNGNLYTSFSGSVYKITPDNSVNILATGFNNPLGVAVGHDNQLYVNSSCEGIIWKVDLNTGVKTQFVDTKILGRGTCIFGYLEFDRNGDLFATSSSSPNYEIIKIDNLGNISSLLTYNSLFNPGDISFDSNENIYVPSTGWTTRMGLSSDAGIWFIDENLSPELFAAFHNNATSAVGFLSIVLGENDNIFFASAGDSSISILATQNLSLEPINFIIIPGDFAPSDCDVDGSDLAVLIANTSLIDLTTLSENFGKNDCP